MVEGFTATEILVEKSPTDVPYSPIPLMDELSKDSRSTDSPMQIEVSRPEISGDATTSIVKHKGLALEHPFSFFQETLKSYVPIVAELEKKTRVP